MQHKIFTLVLVAVLGALVSACSTTIPVSSPVPLGLSAAAPAGYTDFCRREPNECPAPTPGLQQAGYTISGDGTMNLTPDAWKQLDTVNLNINTHTRYVEDEQLYGVSDYWTVAHGAGDCEDFALAKREMLLSQGWPPSALRMAVVYSRASGTHAVLIAATNAGDYVLDNMTNWIQSWQETDYRWIMAQDGNSAWRMAGENAHAVLLAAQASHLVTAGGVFIHAGATQGVDAAPQVASNSRSGGEDSPPMPAYQQISLR